MVFCPGCIIISGLHVSFSCLVRPSLFLVERWMLLLWVFEVLQIQIFVEGVHFYAELKDLVKYLIPEVEEFLRHCF